MRSSPLRSLPFGALILAVTALGPASVLAQQSAQRDPTTSRSLLARLDSGTDTRPSELLSGDVAPASLPAIQDEDYSVTGMFSRHHGEFMQQALQFRPTVQLQYHYYDDTATQDEVGDVQFDGARLDALHRVPVDPDTYLVLGGSYGIRQYDFSQPQTNRAFVKDTDLHEIGVDLGAGRFFGDDLLVEAVFRPGIYSDLSATLTHKDWQFFGDVLATWRVLDGSDGLSPLYLKAGVRVDETFADVPVYPLLGVTWNISESVRLDVLLPEEARVSWMPSNKWILSGGVDVQGDEYHYRMNTGPGPNANNATLEARTQEVRLFLEATHRLSDTFSVFGRGGTVLTGEYEWDGVNNPTGATRDWDGAVDPMLFFEVGIGVNF